MTEVGTIRVLIADDHAVVRQGLRTLIGTEPGMTVVGEAVDGVEAVEMARACKPDVILLDMVMPRKDGLRPSAKSRARTPRCVFWCSPRLPERTRCFRPSRPVPWAIN